MWPGASVLEYPLLSLTGKSRASCEAASGLRCGQEVALLGHPLLSAVLQAVFAALDIRAGSRAAAIAGETLGYLLLALSKASDVNQDSAAMSEDSELFLPHRAPCR